MREHPVIEVPTLLVAAAIHVGWLGLTWFAGQPWVPGWALVGIAVPGGFLVAWHGSLQHEIIHGHPTRWGRVNKILASLPIGLWLPFGIYREQHGAHHRSTRLTCPLDDPESYYVTAQWWQSAGAVRRAVARMQMTAAGRLVLGPPVVVGRFLREEARAALKGDRRHARAWAAHMVGVALVIAWLALVCHLSLLWYVACFVYPGTALTLVRSFAEHRPAEVAAHRIAIVEAGALARLLYLNNNFHAVHHDAPSVPWYELPERYAARRDDIVENNGGFVFRSYRSLLARYAVRPKDSPVHPGS